MLVGHDGKETSATATSGTRRSERVVRIEMGGCVWELVCRRAYVRGRWDLFRLGAVEGGTGEKMMVARRGKDAVGEIVGQGWRKGRFTVYVRREVPVEVVGFAAWMVRKGTRGERCEKENGCAGG